MRAGLVVITVLAAAGRVAAAPTVIARTTADVDGDGASDDVQLTDTGVIVTVTGGKTVTFGLSVKHGRIAADGPWIAIEIEAADGVEGVGLKYKAGGLSSVWRGPIGPQGVDGEWRIDLTAAGGKLVRHQSRADIRRCDGKPALLFAEGWDEQKRTFRGVTLTPEVDARATVLTAATASGAAPRPVVFTALAASTGGGATDASALSAPSELVDGDAGTAWREDRNGDGRGEFITFRAAVTGENGRALWLAPDGSAGANRIKRLAIVGASAAYWVDVPASGAAFRIDLPQPIGDCVSVVIGDVAKGKGAKGGGVTGIAELVVLGDADLAPGGADAALVAQVVAGGSGAHGAADALARRGEPAAAAVVTALAATGLAHDVQVRLLKVLIHGHHAVAATALATGISTVLTGPDVEDATRALAAMGAPAVSALSSLAGDHAQSEEARVAALAALAGIPGADATAALVAVGGAGPRAVRGAVTRALSVRPIGELLADAATPPSDAAAAADLVRGIGLAALHAPDADRARALTVLTTALGNAGDYEGRYRAIQGIAAIGDDAALGELDRTLAKLAAGTETSALHQVAALALARNPARGATTILLRLAAHADPGVRLRAISALAQRTPGSGDNAVDDKIDTVLASVLGGDKWPDLRRAAAGSLGERCQREAPAAALTTAVEGDADLDVRGDALAGLVACQAAGIPDLLIKIASDDKIPLPLRERAVILTVALGDPRLEKPLIVLFDRWRGAAYDSPEALALAQRVAVALGRLGGPNAGAALAAALGDEGLPELVSAVAAGLGELGSACPKTAIPDLRELAESSQQMVAASARRAVAQCGKQ